MSGILSNAISGLQASQNALRTAGHNISNANTQGYSRQEVNYVTRPEQYVGAAGYIGSGVTTASIERVVNEFVSNQVRLDTATFNQFNQYNINIGKVDKLFADVSTGLSGAMQTFFAAMQNGANDPASTPARQLIVTEIEGLAIRFNNLSQRLTDVEKSVNGEVKTITAQIASLAQSIASLNQTIGETRASATGNMPNDLMDKRDEALRQLSELVSIQTVKQDTGDVNVFIGNGQPLVIGTQVSEFGVSNEGQIQLRSNASVFDITTQISGGKIGGLLSFREEILKPSMNELGRIALAMADQFNTLQQSGLDLDGDYGQRLFGDINSPVLAANRVVHGKNAEPYDRILSVTIEDSSKLTTSDYQFEIVPDTQNFIVTRLADNVILEQGVLSGAYPTTISFDGVSLHLTSGSFQGGDSFTIQPTKNGARDITAEIKRPEDLAFASPIRTGSNTSNSGSGVISAGNVVSLLDAAGNRLPAFSQPGSLSPPIIIRFTSATTYDVLDNSDPANPKDLVPAMRNQSYVPGTSNNIFTSDIGETRVTGRGERVGLPEGRTFQNLDPFSVPVNQPMLPGSLPQNNGYLAEQLNFSYVDPNTGAVTSRRVTTSPGASAAQTAALIGSLPGVSANAYTTANVSGIKIDPAALTPPISQEVQLWVNGEPLIQYNAATNDLAFDVPDPNLNEAEFNDYLARRINENPNLQALGFYAQSGSNPVTGAPELRIVASSGVNIDVRLTAPAGGNNYLDVNDAAGNPNVRLTGVDTGIGEQTAITIGGKVDITMANGISLRTSPTSSPLFGDSSQADFASSSFLGYQVEINGQPKAGDSFTLGFNTNAKNDNRNALAMVALETAKTMQDGALSFGDGYGKLVEEVGTKSSLSKINTEASRSLLDQSQSMREGISGVNLDEEAAELIRFQQLYQANAQVISVARQLFDTLLQSL
uniref:flagellar hook-associated protein FlgK n=1 Tax=Cellvibrio fontiphilus TaxID=1815559 RepID=UPI002B4BCBCD|nr:flagellar hook-associated protein FlgK [Cellvibrio fontiphilus]